MTSEKGLRLVAWALLMCLTGVAQAQAVQERICRALRQPIELDEQRGLLLVDTELKAYLPVETEIHTVRVTLAGPDGLIESEAQCAKLVLFPNLKPGEYRLYSLQGRVETSVAPLRFFYPDHDDGYRVPNPEIGFGSSNLYRVQIPAAPEGKVAVQAGQKTYLGQLKMKRGPRSSWGVTTYWEHDQEREQSAWNLVRKLYPDAGL